MRFFAGLFDEDIVGTTVAFVAAVVDIFVPDAAFSELTESSLCHLELFCSAVFICAQRSFLHDFDLKQWKQTFFGQIIVMMTTTITVMVMAMLTYRLIDWSQSLNWVFPSGVIWNAARAARMILAKSS